MDRHLWPWDPLAQLYCWRDADNQNRGREEQPQQRDKNAGFGLTSERLLFRISVKSGVSGRAAGQRWGLGSSDCACVVVSLHFLGDFVELALLRSPVSPMRESGWAIERYMSWGQ